MNQDDQPGFVVVEICFERPGQYLVPAKPKPVQPTFTQKVPEFINGRLKLRVIGISYNPIGPLSQNGAQHSTIRDFYDGKFHIDGSR